jgi:hypothetical protein
MSDNDFLLKLKEALEERREYLERTELPVLKENFRAFHQEISALYELFAKKGYIIEDPYKNETKTGDLHVPPAGNFTEANKRDQLGMRLATLDNELDYLVNFHEFSVAGLPQEKIKVMAGLVKYIDWTRLASAEANVTTQAVNEAIVNMRQGPNDPIAYKTLTDALNILSDSTNAIASKLKMLSDFNREQYKCDLRTKVTHSMNAAEATLANIRKKFAGVSGKSPFYPELAEEVIKEDYSQDSKSLQENILKQLATVETKPKAKKNPASFKPVLIEGLNAIGASCVNLSEILQKLSENHDLLENQNSGLWSKIKKLVAKITNSEDQSVVYNIEYNDPAKGVAVREKLNYKSFYASVEKKIAILEAISVHGSAAKKLECMEEQQLVELLNRNIKDLSVFHKTLGLLDEYFKSAADKTSRSKIKGIKPELSALKNTFMKAGDKLRDYNIRKEEEEQFKKLGVSAEI